MKEEKEEIIIKDEVRTQRMFEYQNGNTRLAFGLWANPDDITIFQEFLEKATIEVEKFKQTVLAGHN